MIPAQACCAVNPQLHLSLRIPQVFNRYAGKKISNLDLLFSLLTQK